MTIVSKEFTKKSKTGKDRKITKYRFAVTYKDVYGKSKRHYSKWFEKKSDCVKEEADFRQSPVMNKSRITFLVVAEAYLKSKEGYVTDNTFHRMQNYIYDEFKQFHNMNISDITPLLLKEYFDTLEGAAKTRNKRYCAMRGIFDYAYTYYGIEQNPMSRIKLFKDVKTVKKNDMNIYTPKEFLTLYNAISPKYVDYKILYHFLYWTGMRRNEAMSLTWDDIEDNVVHIHRQYVDGKWKPLKTKNSERDVVIDSHTLELVMSIYNRQKQSKYFSEDWFIFGGACQLSGTIINRLMTRTCNEIGLRKIRVHDLRHSHISYLISKNVNIYIISRRVGHSSISMTLDIYGHLMPSTQDDVIKAIENDD